EATAPRNFSLILSGSPSWSSIAGVASKGAGVAKAVGVDAAVINIRSALRKGSVLMAEDGGRNRATKFRRASCSLSMRYIRKKFRSRSDHGVRGGWCAVRTIRVSDVERAR